MTGSMYAAIAGLKTHMAKLNVIGNNIANVNTQGYKSQRVVFKDAMYITSRGGSDGTATVGGNNPSQVGYGVETSSIDIDMSTATFQTGRQLDCMINGDGFFVVGDKDLEFDPTRPDDLKRLTLTRVGDFNFDPNGFLVDGKGSCVYGFACVGYEEINNGDGTVTTRPVFSDQLVPLRIPIAYTQADKDKAEGDENAADANAKDIIVGAPNWPTPVKESENATNAEDRYESAMSTADNGAVSFSNVDHLDYHDLTPDGRSNGNPYCELSSITIDRKTGAITGVVKETDDVITIGYLALGSVTNPNGVTHTGGPYYKAMDGAGDLSIGIMGGARDAMGIEYVCKSSLATDSETGPATKMRIGNGGDTGLNTGGLEGSGADLATEITEMITTQRGYQANTRIITVTDSMLEELVNMKRS